MADDPENPERRGLLLNLARFAAFGAVLGGPAALAWRAGQPGSEAEREDWAKLQERWKLDPAANREGTRWQIDPYKCNQCGRCATECVLTPSAVKCVHAFDVCGYCDLCLGYLEPKTKERSPGSENEICPARAIERQPAEGIYYEYRIHWDRCFGCARCVKGCIAYGNSSLYLQILHTLCVNCNECRIAQNCPPKAIVRVPAKTPYLPKTKEHKV